MLQADLRKNEKLFIINSFFKQKAIALIIGEEKLNFNHLSINQYLRNPKNHIYLYNLDGEYIVDIQGYKNENLTNLSFDNLLSVDFIIAPGLDSLTIRRAVTTLDKSRKQNVEECFYNFSYNRKEKDKDEIIEVVR